MAEHLKFKSTEVIHHSSCHPVSWNFFMRPHYEVLRTRVAMLSRSPPILHPKYYAASCTSPFSLPPKSLSRSNCKRMTGVSCSATNMISSRHLCAYIEWWVDILMLYWHLDIGGCERHKRAVQTWQYKSGYINAGLEPLLLIQKTLLLWGQLPLNPPPSP